MRKQGPAAVKAIRPTLNDLKDLKVLIGKREEMVSRLKALEEYRDGPYKFEKAKATYSHAIDQARKVMAVRSGFSGVAGAKESRRIVKPRKSVKLLDRYLTSPESLIEIIEECIKVFNQNIEKCNKKVKKHSTDLARLPIDSAVFQKVRGKLERYERDLAQLSKAKSWIEQAKEQREITQEYIRKSHEHPIPREEVIILTKSERRELHYFGKFPGLERRIEAKEAKIEGLSDGLSGISKSGEGNPQSDTNGGMPNNPKRSRKEAEIKGLSDGLSETPASGKRRRWAPDRLSYLSPGTSADLSALAHGILQEECDTAIGANKH